MSNNGKYHYWISPQGLALVVGWCREGLSDKQIAKNIHISEVTLYEWKKKYPKFTKALAEGKEPADYIIENALHMRASGFTHEEEKIDAEGNKYIDSRYYPPDVNAIKFWLNNRKPEGWQERSSIKQEVEIKGVEEYLKANGGVDV